jgi:hypothetical protein
MNMNDRARLEAMRDQWSDWAFLLQDLYGQEDATCVGIRKCITDLGTFLYETQPKVTA